MDRHPSDQIGDIKRKKSYLMKWTLALLGLLMHLSAFAEVNMADKMRSEGRIYVVIAVMLTILGGIIMYLVRLDKKISQAEKQNNQK